MNDLEHVSALGNRAQHAYDSYIKDFVHNQLQEAHNAFLACPENNTDEVMAVKRLSSALIQLELMVLREIEEGKLARRQIEKR